MGTPTDLLNVAFTTETIKQRSVAGAAATFGPLRIT